LPKVDSYPSYALFLPPPLLKRVFLELQPDLPPQLGGGPLAPLVDGVRFAVVGVDLSAKTSVDIVLQTKDAASAERIEPVLDKAIALVKKNRADQELPFLTKLIEDHRPKRDGDRFVVSLNAAAIDSVLVPAAGKARLAAAIA